ncbi:enoyl-CoA hydratase/isomerase family protein [Nereida sp. MMG025]|uniref:enoyl-CoA hydratase/isomerase family protein n=1 Tax=Nereida sp. MMG025 TaxID=2909981 RepID=UPI001F422ACD|nr:enoyl-CoA hydratase/isomerase family protein [Nereida sp. MMG025]MCF6443635.1 enoyl-CoA hydratase/isomerase family protein [Nereida sp. MMG025]
MTDIDIRIEGRAGRITLTRPQALNALTWEMCLEIEKALGAWAEDGAVALVIIDAEGERAFCSGGDIAEMYATAKAGDFDYGRRFWSDEYRMNRALFHFPKPVITFLQGFTMGGGVGVGCHGSHRIVCESSQIAMPECGIGLVPDVGGSLLLARARGRLGEYLGTTATRMDAADAIYAEFADFYIPEAHWPSLKQALIETGDWEAVDRSAQTPPAGTLARLQPHIDRYFGGESLTDIVGPLTFVDSAFATETLKKMGRNDPLAMAATIEMIHRVRPFDSIEKALETEYRYTGRSAENGSFIEGIRAAIIDKDRSPNWPHTIESVPAVEVSKMLMPIPNDWPQLTF